MTTNGYPFTTRKQIVDRIATEPLFAVECVVVLQAQHEARATGGVGVGWMASHARAAIELAARLAAGDPSAADLEEAAELAVRYSKRLAAHFRARDLAERPELNAVAAVFGVGLLAPVMPTTTASVVVADPAAHAVVVTEATSPSQPITPVVVASPVTTKRRGRPVGSKNKPKETMKSTRRR
jgi:hypothetical protein